MDGNTPGAPDGHRKVSRRWVLQTAAGLPLGVAAASSLAHVNADAAAPAADTSPAPDHDPASGEIFDRERHHHWDTV